MKSIINFIKGVLISCWVVLAIFTTICLISYNDYKVSVFGDYSLFIVDNKELEPTFKKYDVVIVKKELSKRYQKDDHVFFYLGNTETQSYINLGQISQIDRNGTTEDVYYFGNSKVNYSNIVGSANGAIVWHKVGLALSILESRWGFMFFVILPTIFFAVYELYEVINEVKKNSKVDLKEKLRKEIEEEMRQDELKKKTKNEKE